MQDYWSPFGPGGSWNPEAGLKQNAIPDVLVPEIAFLTNDAWPVVRGIANGHGAPLPKKRSVRASPTIAEPVSAAIISRRKGVGLSACQGRSAEIQNGRP